MRKPTVTGEDGSVGSEGDLRDFLPRHWQYAEEPLVGFALTRRALGHRWWDLHLELAALAIMGHERKLVVCSASGCDDRQIGPLGSATAQLILGTPGRQLYSLVGVGGYVSRWSTGRASGIGPRGGLADIGLGSRIAGVKLEARFHGFGNTNYGNAGAVSFRLGIVIEMRLRRALLFDSVAAEFRP